MPVRDRVLSHLLGAAGAAAGGAAGYWLFFWITRQGLYALVLPGAGLGAGCGLLARHTSVPRGVVCGLAALLLGFYAEWKWAPFVADGSLAYFAGHLGALKPITLVMIALGGLSGYWFGKDAGLTTGLRRDRTAG